MKLNNNIIFNYLITKLNYYIKRISLNILENKCEIRPIKSKIFLVIKKNCFKIVIKSLNFFQILFKIE